MIGYSDMQDILTSVPSKVVLKKNLLKYFEVENHPKAEMCFDQSWEAAHSEGYYAVVYDFSERVQLIK